jgi:phosphoenolpyruvate-protein kinase (PTS system EI component)
MAPSAIPRVKEAVRAVRAADARSLAERCLGLATCGEIQELVRGALAPALPGAGREVRAPQ